jgi:hypothetical protein
VNKTLTAAWELVGGLSSPSKMPCHSYSTPAKNCKTGKKLRPVKGSVCNKCYAMKGFYMYPNVKNALDTRYASIYNPGWVDAMTLLISAFSSDYFRWFDSGDLDSQTQLENIVQIAINLPNTKFWLPTREYGIVASYAKKNKIPSNLIIRLSGYMIDKPGPSELASKLGCYTSTVDTMNYTCPASTTNNKCGICRLCWSTTPTIRYKKH